VSDRPHKLGEVLRAAREAREVDLPRVERDTKIRARYHSALERGEYRELPGPVYTKGFLRNYGLYLGLDPEYLVDLYRIETTGGGAERAAAGAGPRPRRRRRTRTFVVTPGAVVAAILTILVGAFIAWLTYEFVNFAGIPELRITQPPGDVAAYHETQIKVVGVTAPDARISVDGLRENAEVTADHQGHFTFVAELVPGGNVLELTATDPKTKRDSETQRRTINVVSTQPTPSPGAVVLDKPAVDATVASPVAISGTAADGVTVTASAALVSAAPPSFSVVDANGTAVSFKPRTPLASPVHLKASGGAFAGSLGLSPGTWDLTVGAPGGAAPVIRRITVRPPAGLTGKLTVTRAESYLELDEDGQPKAGVSGGISEPGASVALSAKAELRIRSGNAGVVGLSINGVSIGPMGASGEVVEWRITRSQ
jgi:cytoskeletal protein RodZ